MHCILILCLVGYHISAPNTADDIKTMQDAQAEEVSGETWSEEEGMDALFWEGKQEHTGQDKSIYPGILGGQGYFTSCFFGLKAYETLPVSFSTHSLPGRVVLSGVMLSVGWPDQLYSLTAKQGDP